MAVKGAAIPPLLLAFPRGRESTIRGERLEIINKVENEIKGRSLA
jgi:hypothetical protein